VLRRRVERSERLRGKARPSVPGHLHIRFSGQFLETRIARRLYYLTAAGWPNRVADRSQLRPTSVAQGCIVEDRPHCRLSLYVFRPAELRYILVDQLRQWQRFARSSHGRCSDMNYAVNTTRDVASATGTWICQRGRLLNAPAAAAHSGQRIGS
jgi:hypothetical protein